MNNTFDLQIDKVRTTDINIVGDLEALSNSLFAAQEAIGVLAKIIIELNRATIEADLGLSTGSKITSSHLKAWSNLL
jgi:hypothetical protein